MRIKHFYLTACLIFAQLTAANSQSLSNIDCTLDSTHFSTVAMYLDTTYMPGQLKYFITGLFPASKPMHYLCSMVLYARVFDKICQKGLDLDTKFSLPERLNIIDLDPSPEKKVYIQNAKTNALIFNCFTDFIYLKTHYDLKIISVYYPTREDAAFERTIEELVNYGGYSHPIMVKNFLLSKYDKFTLEKYNEDLKELRKF